MKIFQGLPSCTEIWKCQTERWMLNLHSVPGLDRRSNANNLKMLKGSAHCERWREKRGPCFQGCPSLSSPYNRTCFSSPVLLSTSSLWGLDLSWVEEWRSWEMGTKSSPGVNPGDNLPRPTQCWAMHVCTIWVRYHWWAGDLFLQRAQSGENFSHLHRGEDREY